MPSSDPSGPLGTCVLSRSIISNTNSQNTSGKFTIFACLPRITGDGSSRLELFFRRLFVQIIFIQLVIVYRNTIQISVILYYFDRLSFNILVVRAYIVKITGSSAIGDEKKFGKIGHLASSALVEDRWVSSTWNWSWRILFYPLSETWNVPSRTRRMPLCTRKVGQVLRAHLAIFESEKGMVDPRY